LANQTKLADIGTTRQLPAQITPLTVLDSYHQNWRWLISHSDGIVGLMLTILKTFLDFYGHVAIAGNFQDSKH
jgi:hypothetical protein